MILLGRIQVGEHAGCWCLLAEVEAQSEAELTPEEQKKLAQARQDYAQVTLWGEIEARTEEDTG